MRLLLINPNTTAAITRRVHAVARAAARRDTKLDAITGCFGARYIASRTAYAIAGHAALDALARYRGRCDAVVLACFGDPGLPALRELSTRPVVGMAEASIQAACLVGRRFAMVTGGERWGPMLEEFVDWLGLGHRLAGIRTVAPTGAEIARDPEAAMALLARECRAAAIQDRADAVILGGAGLAGLAERLQPRVLVPLIDSTVAAIKQAEALGALAPAKAKSGSYAPPAPVDTVGLSQSLARALKQGKLSRHR